jgi:type IV pilus assembly protein PilY1
MAINKRILNKLGITLWVTACIVMPSVSSASTTTCPSMSSTPLFTASNANPNIMFILDNSKSMDTAFGSVAGDTRLSVAKDALSNLMDSLTNVNVAFGTLDPPKTLSNSDEGGLDIVYALHAIGDSGTELTNRTNCKSFITATSSIGYDDDNDNTTPEVDASPLNCALRDSARYFSNDSSGNACGGSMGNGHGGGSYGGGVDGYLHFGDGAAIYPNTALGTRISSGANLTSTDSCRTSFTVMITDGLATYDTTIASDLADYDGDSNSGDGTSTGDGDNLDDMAAALYDVDLRPDLSTTTNNVRTFVVGFDDASLTASNQLLQDTADNGGGTFSYADNATDLASSLQSATSGILNLIGSAAAVTFNTATLGTNSAVYLALFNSSSWSGDLIAYDLNDTSGAIGSQSWSAATKLDAMTDPVNDRVMLTYNNDPTTPANRGGIPFQWPADYTAPTSSELSTAQINDLLTNHGTASGTTQLAAVGSARVDYLRGDKTLDGTTLYGKKFRSRSSLMGDIVHAGPVYVGAPELTWPDGNGTNGFPSGTNAYSIFKYDDSSDTYPGKANRPGVVYVGSNDGFLHGFATEANTAAGWSVGDEVLAYAPSALFSTTGPGYHTLTQDPYDHQFYVDLQPTVSDYYDNNASSWKTVLVGGLRGGGRAMYALDITDPTKFSENTTASSSIATPAQTVMWEFDNNPGGSTTHPTGDDDLGYTFSRPSVVLTNANDGTNYRWAVIFGNGYVPDGESCGSNNCEAALYIVFLDADPNTSTSSGWTSGSDYIKITTGVGSSTDGSHNGLSTPTAVDLDGDGRVDRVYAGDLDGNMWAFNLESETASDWAVATTSGGSPAPLFAGGSNHPITTQPEVVSNPQGSTGSNTIVLFGTGRYFGTSDNSYTTTSSPLGDQYFVGVWDDGGDSYDFTDLQHQTITGESSGQRTVSTTTFNYGNGGTKKKGWYLDLFLRSDTSDATSTPVHTGERSVTNAVVRGDYVWFNTSIPSDELCTYGGTGYQMVVNYTYGTNPDSAIFDSNGDGSVNDNDTALAGESFDEGLPAAPSFLSNHRYTPGTKTQNGSEVKEDTVENLAGTGTGRLSWEELTQ